MGDLPTRIDDFQVRYGLYFFVPAMVASATLCIYFHYPSWSKALTVLTLLLLVASVVLHSVWRMARRTAPAVAIAAFAICIVWTLSAPHYGPTEWLLMGINLTAFAIGWGMWTYMVYWFTRSPWQRVPEPDQSI